MKKILVTGAKGYIGKHVMKELYRQKYEVIGIDLNRIPDLNIYNIDITDFQKIKSFFETHNNIDAVIHLAGKIDVAESMEYPDFYFKNNYLGTKNLLKLMSVYEINKIVFASSAAVYKQTEKLKPYHESDTAFPLSPYGKTKEQAEKLILDYSKQNPCILRLFNVAGAHEDGDIGEDHEPETHLIPNTINCFLNNKILNVYSNCIRDYVHISDVVDAFINGLYKEGIFNIGTGIGKQTLDVIKAIEKIIPKELQLEKKLMGKRKGDINYLVANIDKAKKDLDWQPKRNFKMIIQSAIKYHVKKQEKVVW